ncbi:MAG: hypothetical protein [Bacteriophage sp.]|nr:MAG: hypothetical protein [Bacteriophage sp.]
MKSVLFALDGVLRDAQGEPVRDNIALARALYCGGHDVIVVGPRDGYDWLREHDVTFDNLLSGNHLTFDAERLMFAVVNDEAMAHALKCAGVHTWRYENA